MHSTPPDRKEHKDEIDPTTLPPPPLSPIEILEKATELSEQAQSIFAKDSATSYVLNKVKKQFSGYMALIGKSLDDKETELLKAELSDTHVPMAGMTQNIWFEQLDTLPLKKHKLIDLQRELQKIRLQLVGSTPTKKTPEIIKIDDALGKIQTYLNAWSISPEDLVHLRAQRAQLKKWVANTPTPAPDKRFFNERGAIEKVSIRSAKLAARELETFLTFTGVPCVNRITNRANKDETILARFSSSSIELLDKARKFSGSEREIKELETELQKQKIAFENELYHLHKVNRSFTEAVGSDFNKKSGILGSISARIKKEKESKASVAEAKKIKKSKPVVTFKQDTAENSKKITAFMMPSKDNIEFKNVTKIRTIQESYNKISDEIVNNIVKLKARRERAIIEINAVKKFLQNPLPDLHSEIKQIATATKFNSIENQPKGLYGKIRYFTDLTHRLAILKNNSIFLQMKEHAESHIRTITDFSVDLISDAEKTALLDELDKHHQQILASEIEYKSQVTEEMHELGSIERCVGDQLELQLVSELLDIQTILDTKKEEYKKLQAELTKLSTTLFDMNIVAVTAVQEQYEKLQEKYRLLNRSIQDKQNEIDKAVATLKNQPNFIFASSERLLISLSKQFDMIKEFADTPFQRELNQQLTTLANKKIALSAPGIGAQAEKKVDISAVRAFLERLDISLSSPELDNHRLQTASYSSLIKEKLQSDHNAMKKMIVNLAAAPSELRERANRVFANLNEKLSILNNRAAEKDISKVVSNSTTVFFHRRRHK